ncbi:MAG: amino acid permease [Deltaproteobacteria bacterium]|nr:amino acid permease [Deltaproteobacteria bacterium]
MQQKLARRLGLGALIIYGIGDILGAGIYTTVGKVILEARSGAWLTYILAALLAMITGLSYAELSARFPVSGGAAVFVRRAIPGKFAATMAGIIVLSTGLVSASVVINGFVRYLAPLTSFPMPIAQILLLSCISFLSFWGIQESSRVNILLTFIEVFGLVAVIITGLWIMDVPAFDNFISQAQEDFHPSGIFGAITIAFYAYIGFEDLANLAEECKNPKRDLPRAILIAIIATSIIYFLVTSVLLINVPLHEILQQSDHNSKKEVLLLIFEKAHAHWFLQYFAVIAIIAITNTGLINLIMASRLIYGMAQEDLMPKFLGRIHSKRHTPHLAVLTAFFAVLILVFTGALTTLIKTTNLLIILVFSMTHLSLIIVRIKKEKHDGIQFPIFVPLIGLLLSLAILTQFDFNIWKRSMIILAFGFFIWLSKKISTNQVKEKT